MHLLVTAFVYSDTGWLAFDAGCDEEGLSAREQEIDGMRDGDASLASHKFESVKFSGMSFCVDFWPVFEIHPEWQSLDSCGGRPIEI
jgi:hypothetical protein